MQLDLENANRLAALREDLQRADEEIDAGYFDEYSVKDLPTLSASVEERGMRKLAAPKLKK